MSSPDIRSMCGVKAALIICPMSGLSTAPLNQPSVENRRVSIVGSRKEGLFSFAIESALLAIGVFGVSV